MTADGTGMGSFIAIGAATLTDIYGPASRGKMLGHLLRRARAIPQPITAVGGITLSRD